MVKKETKLNEYGYIVAVLAGSIIIALLLTLVAVRPLYLSLKKTNAEVKEKKIVLQKLEENLANLKSLDSRKAELEEKNQKVLSALPLGKDVPRLFVQMERIASAAGVQISGVSEAQGTVATVAEAGQIMPLYYQVTGTANNYRSLKTALKNIEDSLRLVSVDNINVQNAQTGDTLSISLTVKTFSRGQ